MMTTRRTFMFGTAASSVIGVPEAFAGKRTALGRAIDLSRELPGLQVIGAEIALKGKRFRGIGCNCYGLISFDDYSSYLEFMKSFSIPFVRTNFGSFYPGSNAKSGWRLYFSDKMQFFSVRDKIVEEAERIGIGIIPSMFWRLATVPDLMAYVYGRRDALDQLGNRKSNTRHFMNDITAEFVDRYKHSTAIWGWEIGNEFSLSAFQSESIADSNHGQNGIPIKYFTQVAQNEANGQSDIITYPMLFDVYRDWSDVVQRHDTSNRLRSSGAPASIAQFYGIITGTSRAPDRYNQWMAIPPSGLPAPLFESPKSSFNVISAHLYQEANLKHRYFRDDEHDYNAPGLLTLIKQIAVADRRPLFVGEFGSLAGQPGQDGKDGTDKSSAGEKRYFMALLDKLVEERIPISAVWNYGPLSPSSPDIFDIGPSSGREYQLFAIAGANQRMND